MHIEYHKEFSKHLQRDMEYKIFGDAPLLGLVFPTQDGRFYEWEDRHMFDTVYPLIESNQIMFCTLDSVDYMTFSDTDGIKERLERQEWYMNYVLEEIIPRFSNKQIITIGASLGAFHAINTLLRRPESFTGCICLSGVYEMSLYYCGYEDENTKKNNPCLVASKIDVDRLKDKTMIFCVGQGDYEWTCAQTQRQLDTIFAQRSIPAIFDYWGYDVAHDWYWWERQFPYFVEKILKKEE